MKYVHISPYCTSLFSLTDDGHSRWPNTAYKGLRRIKDSTEQQSLNVFDSLYSRFGMYFKNMNYTD